MGKKVFCTMLICLISLGLATAESNKIYLGDVTFGARAMAIGGLTAGSHDVTSVYWNPADTVNNTKTSLIYGRNNKFGFANWHEDQIGLVISKRGCLGLGGFYFKDSASLNSAIGDRAITNPWSTSLFGLSTGLNVIKGFSMGATLMGLSFNGLIDGFEEETHSLLGNIGIKVSCGFWQLGLVARNYNLGGKLKVDEEYNIGLAWENLDMRIQIEAASYIPPESNKRELRIGGGIELVFRPELSFRLGRRKMRLNEQGYLTAGVSATVGKLTFDYTYAPHIIDSTHYLSTGLEF